MKRINYHVTDQQLAALKKEAKRTGLKVAEIIRQAINAHLKLK
jgi:predicted DNA binding CopG/RHH family protein